MWAELNEKKRDYDGDDDDDDSASKPHCRRKTIWISNFLSISMRGGRWV